MVFEKTKLKDVFIVKRAPFEDERGTFARMFCKNELESNGLYGDIAQVNLSTNKFKGTLRGLHSQKESFAEDKFVTCIRGSIFDVCVDVRKDSATYSQWVGVELSDINGTALYVPKGCAHGYLTLTDDAHVLYFVTQFYAPDSEIGYRYDDPAFSVDWPLDRHFIMSEKDENWSFINGGSMI